MCQKFSIFQLLLKIQKLYLLITFNRGIVLNFFQHIWNQCEILHFLIPISILKKNNKFLGHISTFCKLSSQMRPKRLKITKNVFYKNVLESDLAPIKGSGSFIFLKKFKIVSPYCSTNG